MSTHDWLTIAQTAAIVAVGFMEYLLIRELRATRAFLQKINDNVLGAVGANMALNTALTVAQTLINRQGGVNGE